MYRFKSLIFFLILFVFSASLFSNNFKNFRTKKLTPLSDTLIEIERKGKISPKTYSTLSSKISLFEKFNNQNSKNRKWKMKINSWTKNPKLITGDKTKKYYGTPEQIFIQFITENKDLLNVDIDSLKLVTKTQFLNTIHLFYKQYYKGLPVEFSYVKLHMNSKGEITQYNARYYPYINIDLTPTITPQEAKIKILGELGNFSVESKELVIYPDELNEKFILAWKITGTGGYDYKAGDWVYYVDAKNGEILFRYDQRQYACTLQEETSGVIKAEVYKISPKPTGIEAGPSTWVSKITVPVENQYVFYGNNYSSTTTKSDGEYCIDYGSSGSKVFMTVMGPYFSVMNFEGNHSFYTNTSYTWKSAATSLSVTGYSDSSEYTYSVSPTLSYTSSQAPGFVVPVFSNFSIGKVDTCSNPLDNDMVYVLDSNKNAVATWFGYNKSNLSGGLVPASNYYIKLKTDEESTYNGSFTINISSYMVLDNFDSADNATGSITWSTNNYIQDNNGASINAFYHLNKIRDFLQIFNSKCTGGKCVDLDKRVPVMIHTFGDITTSDCFQSNTMWNAFYDLKHDAIFLGKGIKEPDGSNYYYKDFALDGTVIRHEYIHLLINRIYPIIYFGEFGAIQEALSDYFALSSFWNEGETITILGNFIGTGEGAARDLATLTNKMPDDWVGQVHDDGKILAGVLYKLRKDPTYDLGTIASGAYAGLHRADLLTFATLFYFPDNFENFKEAMLDFCKEFENSTTCSVESKINDAFSQHGIGNYTIKDSYEPNNGPEYATDISSFSNISAYIDYQGDIDYYVLPLNEGLLHVRLNLPESSNSSYQGFYNAYNIMLFDSNRNLLTDASPIPSLSLCYSQYLPNNCLTQDKYVDLYYSITKPQIYYLMVSAYYGDGGGNGPDYNRTNPYTIEYEANLKSTIRAEVTSRSLDQDTIEISAIIPKFPYITDPLDQWSGYYEHNIDYTNGLAYIQLLDHNLQPLSTDYVTINNMQYTTDSTGNPLIKGTIQLTSYNGKTFSQRYPYVGTVYIKLYVSNHMFNIGNKTDNYVSLGISNPVNLTASKNELITYNNIIDDKNSKMTVTFNTVSESNIKISVYTPTGKLVKTLYDGPATGKNSIDWDGTDSNGKKLSSGIYYIKTEGAVNKVEKVAIVR